MFIPFFSAKRFIKFPLNCTLLMRMNIHLHSCDLFSIRTLKLDKLHFIIGFSTSFATCIEPPISNYLIYIHKMYKINNSGRSLNVEHDDHKYLHIYWHRNFLNLPLFCRKLLLLRILYKCRSNIIWEKKNQQTTFYFIQIEIM